jgi:hypothetical protein
MTPLTSATRGLNGVAGVVTPRWACGPACGRITKRCRKSARWASFSRLRSFTERYDLGQPQDIFVPSSQVIRGYALFAREM